ncbi:MAG: hypothetical protein FJ086_07945 [Deltaproteobacteria bacterium]|nr:hypothetical protein [Deltaproteobacteria bacterium]
MGVLGAGTVLCLSGYALHAKGASHALVATLFAVGGLMVVFGSCEAMILAVQGVGQRLGWNEFVAGNIAGLASNVPEVVMLGFVVAQQPRVAFIVVALTLHVNALAFGVYSALLPRDATGQARMPDALVRISTDLVAAGGGVFLSAGLLMVCMKLFETGEHRGEGFGALDLAGLGVVLLLVQAVATVELIKRSPKAEAPKQGSAAEQAAPSWERIGGYALVGGGASLLGGHAVGDFADILVEALTRAGYSEMFGALVLSVFSGAGTFVMMISAHARKMYDIALAGVSGAITQVPFVVLPAVLLMMAGLAQLGVIPMLARGSVLPIDLETTSVVLLAFPPMLILYKSVQDDGKVSWVETAGMVAVFAVTIYFLARHG